MYSNFTVGLLIYYFTNLLHNLRLFHSMLNKCFYYTTNISGVELWDEQITEKSKDNEIFMHCRELGRKHLIVSENAKIIMEALFLSFIILWLWIHERYPH